MWKDLDFSQTSKKGGPAVARMASRFMCPDLNKGENDVWRTYRITPCDPSDWNGQWRFDTRRPVKLAADFQRKGDRKNFYLKNFKGTTDAELHKAAISAAAGWRME